jgi:hypothetical protein
MPYLRPPIAVHVPEEWDWCVDPIASSAPINRLAHAIVQGLFPYYAAAVRDDAIYIERPPHVAPRDRILISPGDPHRTTEAWYATDRDTYDGAPDAGAFRARGTSPTPAAAARELLYIMCEDAAFSSATLAAIAAEIARRWP